MTAPSRVHAPRRTPAGPTEPLHLRQEAAALLAEARTLRSGRSARTLTPGAGAALTQSLLALTAGQHLQDHVAPGPTTLQIVIGTAVLSHGHETTPLGEGRWASCPTGAHSLEATTDTVVLLTVAPST